MIYELCDEYGIYMIDETNLESHGSWDVAEFTKDYTYVVPHDKPEWLDMMLDRANSMYQRDKNHAAILIWSCGNESFGGKDIFEMSQFFHKEDPTRLVHYEGLCHDRRYNDTSDMESQMYPSVEAIKEFLAKDSSKPFICCEYTHAMGNSCGAMHKYTDLTDTEPKSQAAVLYDRENDWAIADVQGPRNEDMHYRENVQKNYRALREQGLNVDIIAMEHDLADYKVLAAPMAYMFKDGYEEKLRAYVENGGTLVLSYWSGLVDGTDRCFLGGTPYGLMDVAGIRSTEIDALYDWEENHAIPEAGSHLGISNVYTCKNLCELVEVSDAEVLMRYGEDFYQGYPVLTHKAFGKGHIYYVCADMELGFYQDFYGKVAVEADLKSPIEIIPEGVSVTVRENEDTEYLFIQNYARKPQAVPVPAEYELLYGTESEVMAPLQTRILKKHK